MSMDGGNEKSFVEKLVSANAKICS
jgi:hypothetical protein